MTKRRYRFLRLTALLMIILGVLIMLAGIIFGLILIIRPSLLLPLATTVELRNAYTVTGAGSLIGGLLGGLLLTGLGWGAVEAASNPMVAALYPEEKTHRLNILHAWWPAGIVVGGLLGVGITAAGLPWELNMLVLMIPSLVLAWMVATSVFPVTERVAAGVGRRVREVSVALGRPQEDDHHVAGAFAWREHHDQAAPAGVCPDQQGERGPFGEGVILDEAEVVDVALGVLQGADDLRESSRQAGQERRPGERPARAMV